MEHNTILASRILTLYEQIQNNIAPTAAQDSKNLIAQLSTRLRLVSSYLQDNEEELYKEEHKAVIQQITDLVEKMELQMYLGSTDGQPELVNFANKLSSMLNLLRNICSALNRYFHPFKGIIPGEDQDYRESIIHFVEDWFRHKSKRSLADVEIQFLLEFIWRVKTQLLSKQKVKQEQGREAQGIATGVLYTLYVFQDRDAQALGHIQAALANYFDVATSTISTNYRALRHPFDVFQRYTGCRVTFKSVKRLVSCNCSLELLFQSLGAHPSSQYWIVDLSKHEMGDKLECGHKYEVRRSISNTLGAALKSFVSFFVADKSNSEEEQPLNKQKDI